MAEIDINITNVDDVTTITVSATVHMTTTTIVYTISKISVDALITKYADETVSDELARQISKALNVWLLNTGVTLDNTFVYELIRDSETVALDVFEDHISASRTLLTYMYEILNDPTIDLDDLENWPDITTFLID